MAPRTNYKDVSETIRQIDEFNKESTCIIRHSKPIYDRVLGRLNKDSDKFVLELSGNDADSYSLGEIKNISLESSKHTFIVDRLFVSSISSEGIRGDIHSLKTDNFNEGEKKYFRLVIPLNKKMEFLYHFKDLHTYKTKMGSSVERILITIKENTFDLYQYLYQGNIFAILECIEPTDFESFSKASTSIFLGFGFITGYFAQNEGFYITFANEDFSEPESIRYLTLIRSIVSHYPPIYSNAYGYLKKIKDAGKINLTLKGISKKVFSNLCQQVYNSPEIAATIFLLLQGTELTVQGMAGCFSIALETMTSLICENNKDKLSPIKDKKIAKKLRKELKDVITKHSAEIDTEVIEILSKKIDQINQPTNRDKLFKPFEIYKVDLNKDDIKCIDSRNDFLHGRMPNIPMEVADSKTEFRNIFHIAMKLNLLASVLILKHAGFSGKVVNYARIHEDFTRRKIDEVYFRKI